jgi:rubrerythrin
MTVQQDLQKAIASAKSAEGSYAVFAASTQDQVAKAMYQDMAQDMQRHQQILQSRLQYLNSSNALNQQQQQKQQQQQAQAQQQMQQQYLQSAQDEAEA